MYTLAKFLKEARVQKGLMVREFAQSFKIDHALVSKFESGARKPILLANKYNGCF